jgi:hypothetical protein
MGLSFTTTVLALDIAVILRPEVQRDLWPHFTVSDSRLPQPGGPGPRIYIPRNMVARFYPQALGSLFVAFYDSQGGGIRELVAEVLINSIIRTRTRYFRHVTILLRFYAAFWLRDINIYSLLSQFTSRVSLFLTESDMALMSTWM